MPYARLQDIATNSKAFTMTYTIVFETDSLPFLVGGYQTLDEAYQAAIDLVKKFQQSGLPSVYKFTVESQS